MGGHDPRDADIQSAATDTFPGGSRFFKYNRTCGQAAQLAMYSIQEIARGIAIFTVWI